MVSENLRERWIQAMCKVPMSLIGYKGYTREEAEIVCNCFRESAPFRPKLELVLALERETRDLPIFNLKKIDNPIIPEATKIDVIKNPKTKIVRIKKAHLNPNDYPGPWCKVIKDGKVIRYEDANAKPIPEELWPK